MSRPRVTVLARDQGFAPLGWLYTLEARATRTRVIAQTLCVPEPQASLLTGILLGDDAGIPKCVHDGHVSRDCDIRLDVKPNRMWRLC